MPSYQFKNTETGEIYEQFMSIAAMEHLLVERPHVIQYHTSAPSLGDPIKLGITKTPTSFRELLKHMKGKHKGSTINNG